MNPIKKAELVKHIVNFTALRDEELLELSLLKSVFTTLNPLSVSLITIDINNMIVKQVDYSATKYGYVTYEKEAEDNLVAIIERLDNENTDHGTFEFGKTSKSVFLLAQNRRVSNYVVIDSFVDVLTEKSLKQVFGMLKIFQNFRALIQESQIDPLTGLLNRKSFNDTLSNIYPQVITSSDIAELSSSNQSAQSEKYFLALIDLDNFKSINDNFGHLMGDEALVRVAQCIKDSIREVDFAFRYGGEEFAVIFPSQSRAEIAKLCEKIRVNIEAMYIAQIGAVTASFGIVELRTDVFYLTSIELADTALYSSKQNGKNKITFADNTHSMPSSGDIELF